MGKIIGIDLGTSGVKALLIAEDQTVIASATAPLTVSRPAPGWSEQAPEDWLAVAKGLYTASERARDKRFSSFLMAGIESYQEFHRRLGAPDTLFIQILSEANPKDIHEKRVQGPEVTSELGDHVSRRAILGRGIRIRLEFLERDEHSKTCEEKPEQEPSLVTRVCHLMRSIVCVSG